MNIIHLTNEAKGGAGMQTFRAKRGDELMQPERVTEI
jgi:hypothetical protein